MEEEQEISQVLDALSNIPLNERAKQALKNLFDDALSDFLLCSSTEEASNAPPRNTIRSLHPDPLAAVKQQQQQSAATNAKAQQRLVSDLSGITVSSQRSDYPQPPVKRCRDCNTKQPVFNSAKPVTTSSSSLSTASSVTTGRQPRMQKTIPVVVVTQSQPWLTESNPCYSTGHVDGFGRPEQRRQHRDNCCCQVCTESTSMNYQLRGVADLVTPATSDARHEVERTCRPQTIQIQMLEEPESPAGGLESSSQGVQEDNVVYYPTDTMESRNVSQRPQVTQNVESRPPEESQYVHGFMVPPGMKGAKEKMQMPSPTGHSLAKAHSHKKHLEVSTAIRPTLLDYEIPSSRKAQHHHLHSRSRTSNKKSQQWKSDTEEEWSSSVRSRSYSPSSSSFTSYSRSSRQQTSTGSGSSNSDNSSRSYYSPRESVSESSSTVEQSNKGSSYASSSYRNTGGRDGDSGSRSTRYRRSRLERTVGRFKRFKDKLGLIFHHHHHHHHHHHDKGKQSKNGNKATTWKNVRSMFHHEDKHELHAEKALVKKNGKLAVEKNHGKQFHGLVQGLMHHVKNSKNSKTSEVARRRMFKQHGRVKLPKRRQFKVGFRGKKPRLKAAKR